MFLSVAVSLAVFYSLLTPIQSDCEPVEIASNAIVMTEDITLVAQNLKHNSKDKLQDIYDGLYASKKLLQINDCDEIYLLSLKEDAFSILFSPEMKDLKEKHSDIPKNIKKHNKNNANNIYRSIGLLHYSGHGFLSFTKSLACTATLITPKHILTSAHCFLYHKKNKVYSFDLNNYKFFPSANRQYVHWIDHFAAKYLKFSETLQNVAKFFTLNAFVHNKDMKYVGIKNIFIPYLYIQDLSQEDWILVELDQELKIINDELEYSLMPFGFNDNLSSDLKLSSKGMIHFSTAGYPGNERCCKLFRKAFDVKRIDYNVLHDNIHKHYKGQSGSPIWLKQNDKLSYVMYGILMGGELIGTDAWRITKDEYYTICDLIQNQYPNFCD